MKAVSISRWCAIALPLMALCTFTAGGAQTEVKENEQMRLARLALSRNEPDLAKKHLQQAIDKSPREWEAYYLLGLTQGQTGQYDLSAASAASSIKLHPAYAPAYSVLGRALARQNKLNEAATALETACRLEPKVAVHHFNLGSVYALMGKHAQAYSSYEAAARLSPKYTNAYLGMAASLGKKGDSKGQIEVLNKACQIDPQSAIAHARLGMVLSESGDISGGMREGATANALRLKDSWNEFLGMFLTAWACVFFAFAALFAVVFAGSKFKPQDGEKLIRSFFLTFYKDKPGRFVVTDQRLVFVPEAFSAWFGSTRVSIQREQIESINYLSTVGGGTVSILTRDQSVHQFRMPLLVLDPLRSLLVSQGIVSKEPATPAASASESVPASVPVADAESAPLTDAEPESVASEKVDAEDVTTGSGEEKKS